MSLESPLRLKRDLLEIRSALLKEARAFFYERGLLEVDCPALCSAPTLDNHIESFSVPTDQGIRYLHTSPEHAMKRLLVEGSGDIFQLSHVYRFGELGKRHQPEFTLVEWYRLGFSLQEMMQETISFIEIFLGVQTVEFLSYREAFLKYTELDPFEVSEEALKSFSCKQGIAPSQSCKGKDEWLNLILGVIIEPILGMNQLTLLHSYPKSQAALAQVTHDSVGEEVAERFEVYFQGIELANGYTELKNAAEQRLRFEEANTMRINEGKQPLPLDFHFLNSLQLGLPPCSGVAVGFDRLIMLHLKADSLERIVPWAWEQV